MLYYLSTNGLQYNHEGTVVNQSFMNEIGNDPQKVEDREFIINTIKPLTKKCN